MLTLDKFLPDTIIFLLVQMDRTIYFNNESCLGAVKIDDEAFNTMLTPESETK